METPMEQHPKEVRTYQLTYLFPSAMTEETVTQRRNEITQQLTEKGANVTEGREATKKKLAYPIARQTYGFMGEVQFWASSEILPAIQQALKHIDGMVRFMITHEEPHKVQQRVRPNLNKTAGGDSSMTPRETMEDRASPRQSAETSGEAAQSLEPREEPKKETHFKEKISIEDIDKRLDEIMKNI